MTHVTRRLFSGVAALVAASTPIACGPRAGTTAPAEVGARAAPASSKSSRDCAELERTAAAWIASGRYGRAVVTVAALRGAPCDGAQRLSSLIEAKRKELGLDASVPAPGLRLALSRLRALRAAGQVAQARTSVEQLLAANSGQAFVLAEAGLIEQAGANSEPAQRYFDRAMLALGPPELEPAEERYRDFQHVAFGAQSAELWSCNARARVTDVNTLEPLFRIPLARGCRGLDAAEGALATTAGLLDPLTFAETPFAEEARAVRFGGKQLLTVADGSGSGTLSFAARSASGEVLGTASSLPVAGAGDLGVSSDPEGTWTVVSSTDSAWAFDRATSRAPLALEGPAVAVRGKKAVVNRGDYAELIELPSKRRLKRVALQGCPPAAPPSADISWAAVSRDGSTVALLRCSSISTWRWADESATVMTGDPAEIRAPGGELEPFALAGDGSLLVRASSSTLQLFDTRTGKKLRESARRATGSLTVAAAPSGALALTTAERRTFVVSERGELERELANPDRCRLGWYGRDAFLMHCERELRIVARADGRTLSSARLEQPASAVLGVPPEQVAVVRDQRTQLLQLGSGKVERELAGRVAWASPDGKLALAVVRAPDNSSSLMLQSLTTGVALAKANDGFSRAEYAPATGAVLAQGADLWYFEPPTFRATRLAERGALVRSSALSSMPTSLRFSADQRRAVVGFAAGESRVWDLATARELSGAVLDSTPGLAWSGNRGYRRSDGKHVVTLEATPSGTAFSVTTPSGFIDYLGAEPEALPDCSFGPAQFPFSVCRDAVRDEGLLGRVMEHGEWFGVQ